MKRLLSTGLVAIAMLSAAGCVRSYTNIEKADDGSYMVTAMEQGFWRVHGLIYRCQPAGNTMTCTRTGSD